MLAALQEAPDVRPILVHTGQHYDPELSSMFFEDLGISAPDWMLGVGSGSHAEQTARVMMSFEAHCLEDRPDGVVVVGDVNSTLACTLVASKLQIPVVHVEAGLRSRDRTMPEELNRLATDVLADRLYTHCQEAVDNLLAEGIPESRICPVGNVMIDSLLRVRTRAKRPANLPAELLVERGYGLVTLHRPALVDNAKLLKPMLDALASISRDLPLIYPVHPRAMARMARFGLISDTQSDASLLRYEESMLHLCKPIRYQEFLWLMDHARLLITDSGGIQEETTALGVPCLTVRENTERAVTIHEGTNELIGVDPQRLLEAVPRVLAEEMPRGDRVPAQWDGQAGQRIIADLVPWLRARKQ
tara:strand:- start:259 stop:1338 length:1080 start_codon:yes stop_codon:yes gene_type:complete